MPFITQGKANLKYLLIVFLVAVVAGGLNFIYLNNFQKEITSLNNFNEIEKTGIDCQKHNYTECPDGCVVCPPCKECSSLACWPEQFCKNIGFDKSWYESIKAQPEIANWKTYKNEAYGFELKYPRDWNYASDMAGSSVSSLNLAFCSPINRNSASGCKEQRIDNITTNIAEIRLFAEKWSDLPAIIYGATKEEKEAAVMHCLGWAEVININGTNVKTCKQDNEYYSALWEDPSGSYMYHLFGLYKQDPNIFNQMLFAFIFIGTTTSLSD